VRPSTHLQWNINVKQNNCLQLFYFTNEYWIVKPTSACKFSERAKERGGRCLLVPQCSYGPGPYTNSASMTSAPIAKLVNNASLLRLFVCQLRVFCRIPKLGWVGKKTWWARSPQGVQSQISWSVDRGWNRWSGKSFGSGTYKGAANFAYIRCFTCHPSGSQDVVKKFNSWHLEDSRTHTGKERS